MSFLLVPYNAYNKKIIIKKTIIKNIVCFIKTLIF